MTKTFSIDKVESPEYAKATLRAAINHYGPKIQSLKAIEECGELQRAISRELAYQMNNAGNHREILRNLEEEWADAMIMLLQLGMMYDFSGGMVQVAINDLMRRLANEGTDICDQELVDNIFDELRYRTAEVTVKLDGETHKARMVEGD